MRPFPTLGWLRQRIVFKRGSHLLRKEQWQKAASLLRRASRLDRHHWESHNNLATALLKLGQWEDAAGVVQRAISLDPTAAESHAHFGIALLKMERWEEAVAAYHRAISLNPDYDSSHERLGIALAALERWGEAAVAFQRAIELRPLDRSLHERLGTAFTELESWDEAANAFRSALEMYPRRDPPTSDAAGGAVAPLITLAPGEPDAYAGFANALMKLPPSEQAVAVSRQAVAVAPDNPGAHLGLAVELLKLGRWDEAQTALAKGGSLAALDTTFHFLRVDPLLRLGRPQEAAAAQARTVGRNGPRPPLTGESVSARLERRQPVFWTRENLSADAFRVERWLDDLSAKPTHPGSSTPAAKLLFILDNDYGELTTLMYFLLGQRLSQQTTLLLTDRLYAHNPNVIPGRTHRYESLEDVMDVVKQEKPDIVFLCSGYLFAVHDIFTLETLERLIQLLRKHVPRLVTSDPFLGLLSQQDPRTLLTFAVPEMHPWRIEELTKKKRFAEEKAWGYFTRAEHFFRDMVHLYPTFPDLAKEEAAKTDSRNISFFNANLLMPSPAENAEHASVPGDDGKPHWLFILARNDYDLQLLFEGESRFADIVAAKLVETLAAGRHPILIAPNEFVKVLVERLPTAEGVDILSYCSFRQFTALLLSAEYAFYWNVVSHSLLMRLFNGLPIVLFADGHLTRGRPTLLERVIAWYYQGWRPTFRDHRQPLTLETVEGWTNEYRQEADRIVDRFRRAPTPEQMIASLMENAAPFL